MISFFLPLTVKEIRDVKDLLRQANNLLQMKHKPHKIKTALGHIHKAWKLLDATQN